MYEENKAFFIYQLLNAKNISNDLRFNYSNKRLKVLRTL